MKIGPRHAAPRGATLAALASCALATILVGGAPLVPTASGARAQAADDDRRTPVVRAVEQSRPAVVNIAAEQVVVMQRDPFFEQFFNDFFEMRPRRQRYTRTSLGSGVIVRPEGYVVTNAHVVARGQKIKVVLADERELDARVVGVDPDADLAVLKIQGGTLPHLEFGESDDLMIGETVIAIGNPFGFSHTVTTGVVSAVRRSLKSEGRVFLDFIQTDASINPGNSGGPLLNIKGELIGINTAIYGGAQNIGFAIPAKRASRIVADLIRYGEVRRSYLGLQVQDLTPELASALGADARHGVVVREVEDGSPAERAGLEPGDVILEVDGQDVGDRAEFDERAAAAAIGSTIRLDVLRSGSRRRVTVAAGELTDERIDDVGWRRLGIRVAERGRDDAVTIDSVRRNSHADRAGIRPGDLLIALGGTATDSTSAYRRAVSALRGESETQVAVQRGRAHYRLTLPLE
ncbi:MAG: trypsin-like peptidase domain-containing protein [Thermodesulfobacteriota bacterium]